MPASDRSGELGLEGSALHRGILVPGMSRCLGDGLDFALGDPGPGDRDGSRARSDDRVVCGQRPAIAQRELASLLSAEAR